MQIKNLIILGGFIAIVVIAFYFIGIASTDLKITSNDSAMNSNITALNISGVSENYAQITINGENVQVDKNGNFYKVVQIQNGVNVYTVLSKAPFKSTNQINITAKRNEHSDGSVSGVWYCNATSQKEY